MTRGGRPPIGQRIAVRFDDDTRAQLNQIAVERLSTLADVIRQFTLEGLAAYNTPPAERMIEQLQAIGFKGVVDRERGEALDCEHRNKTVLSSGLARCTDCEAIRGRDEIWRRV